MTRKFLVIAVALAGQMAMTHEALAHPEAAVRPPALSPISRTYLRLYHRVVVRHGGRAPGRNIVRNGLSDGHEPTARHLRTSIAVLRRMLAPVRVVTVAASTPVAQAAVVSSTPTNTGGGLPDCTWRPESGGSYTAVNPSSGAGGKYQIIPSTWKAYGGSGSSAATASPAEQDAVARRVYAGQGAGAWVNC